MKRKTVRQVSVCLLLLLCLAFVSGDQGGKAEGAIGIPQGSTIVRVALDLGQSSIGITVRQGAYTLVNPDSGAQAGIAATGSSVRITPSGAGISVTVDGAAAAAGASRIVLAAVGDGLDIAAYGDRTYRGSFVVENRGGSLQVVNVLDVDLYLLGVVPMEMGLSTAPPEALKAQAVVSRTYALNHKSPGGSYDLRAGGSDQVYGGYGNERANTTAAVVATRGQAIHYDGQLIEAFFSSNSGGFTEDSENVWNEALPYARAVASPYDAFALQARQDSNGYPGNTYQWQVRYSVAELQSRIAQWNRDYPDSRINIGNFRSLQAYAYALDPATRRTTERPNSSGRITRLDLVGSDGTFTLYRESVRTFLGLRSAMFVATPEGGVAVRNGAGVTVMLGRSIRESLGLIADGLPAEINRGSNSFFVATAEGIAELRKDDAGVVTGYVFDGNGYGHGVGMSQWGAIGMADAGMSYGQILDHYYNQGKNDGRLTVRAVG